MNRGLRSEADRLHDKVVRFTKELISIRSPSLHEDQVAVRVQEEMRKLDFDLSFTDEVGNVIGLIAGGDPKCSLLLNSPMDAVHPWGHESREIYPFGGKNSDERIVEDGDCKAGIATQVYAAHVLAESRVERRVNFVVAATVAEESGCSVGVRHLLQTTLPRLGVEPRFCILGNPTGLDVVFGHDGWVCIDLDVLAKNFEAVTCAAELVFRVLRVHCDTGGKERAQAVMASEKPVIKNLNFGCRSRIRVLRRLFLGERAEHIVGWLRQLAVSEVRGMHDVQMDVHLHEEDQEFFTGQRRTVLIFTQPWSTDLTHPLVNRARESLVSAGFSWNPCRWSMDRLGMGTAGGAVSVEFGVPTIGFGPGEEIQLHSANESSSLAKLGDAVFGTAVLMHGFNREAKMMSVAAAAGSH